MFLQSLCNRLIPTPRPQEILYEQSKLVFYDFCQKAVNLLRKKELAVLARVSRPPPIFGQNLKI